MKTYSIAVLWFTLLVVVPFLIGLTAHLEVAQ